MKSKCSVRSDTPLLFDPTENRKEFSFKMEFVTCVRDANRSSKKGRNVLMDGRHGGMGVDGIKRAFTRFGCKTPKTISQNALQPLSMQLRRISALKK